MFGDNPKRPPLKDDGTSLEIKNIFKTIQGEGPLAGVPAIFIRLGGCNLACNFCDTEFEDFTKKSIGQIIAEVNKFSLNSKAERKINLVVITGGEPFRQSIELLCEKLIEQQYQIQIETNGTLFRPLPNEVLIICSPKVTGKNYSYIREDLLPKISALKFLIAKNIKEYSHTAEVGQTRYNIPVYVQAMDQYNAKLNKNNMALTVELALEHGYRISCQTHKMMDIE